MTDIQALREHLVAEERGAYAQACRCQRQAADRTRAAMVDRGSRGVRWSITRQLWRWYAHDTARTATDAWLAADARLRALDTLIARAT